MARPRLSSYDRYWLWLQDEIPKLGSGVRLVHAKVGYKWVYIKREYKNRIKIKKALWDSLNPVTHCKLSELNMSLAEYRNKVRNGEKL